MIKKIAGLRLILLSCNPSPLPVLVDELVHTNESSVQVNSPMQSP